MKTNLSTIWNPPNPKAKVIVHSLRLLVCVGIWHLPDFFAWGAFTLTLVQSIVILLIMPSWCRSMVFALIGILLSIIGAGIDESDKHKDIPDDAIPGDPGPAWSEEWKEPFSWTRFYRD